MRAENDDMSELTISRGVTYAGSDTQNAPRTYYGLNTDAWMRIGVLALLMVALFWPNLRRLWLKTNPVTGEANWGNACFVPLIGLYFLYVNRDGLLNPSSKRASKNNRAIGLCIQLQVVISGLLAAVWGYFPNILHGRSLIGIVIAILVIEGRCAVRVWRTVKRTADSTLDRL